MARGGRGRGRDLVWSRYMSEAPLMLSSLFAHVRSLPIPIASRRWCHSNMMGDSQHSANASKKPGMDFKHWFVRINLPEINKISIEDQIRIFIKTLATVIGSEEEAKKKIYKVNCYGDRFRNKIGIGCELDCETSNLLRRMPYVGIITPDYYADPENKENGGDIIVINGKPFYYGDPENKENGGDIIVNNGKPFVRSRSSKRMLELQPSSPDYYADLENKDYGGDFIFINGKPFERSSKRMLELQPSSSVGVLEKPWTELLSSRPIPSPWLLLPPPAFGDQDKKLVYHFYSVAEGKEFSINRNEEEEEEDEFVGSSHGWLALFRRRNCQLFLSNPVSGQHIKLPSIPKTFLELGSQVGKVIISCSPLLEEEQCRIVMIFGPKNRLAFCSPCHRAAQWTPISSSSSFSDIIYSHSDKLFLCLTNCGRLEGWDLSDPALPRMVEEHKFDVVGDDGLGESKDVMKTRLHYTKYLALDEQSEELFIVKRLIQRHQSGWGYYVQSPDPIYPYETVNLEICKIDKERKRLFCCAETLNGLVMFIGTNHSFTLAASEYPEFYRNCILYTDEKRLIPPNWAALPNGVPDIEVYQTEAGLFCSKYNGREYVRDFPEHNYPFVRAAKLMKRVPPLPMWFTPTLH